MKNTRILVFMGLFIAMDIVLTRFFAFQTPIVRISFSFIPVAFSGIMFGPVIGGLTAMLADILGMMLFPTGGAYFPGFTFSALLTGAIYGLYLHRNPKSLVRTVLAVITIIFVVDVGLNTIWITMLTGKAASAIIPLRLTKSIIMVPVQIILINSLWRYVGEIIYRNFSFKRT